jgi:hypothetical protein
LPSVSSPAHAVKAVIYVVGSSKNAPCCREVTNPRLGTATP